MQPAHSCDLVGALMAPVTDYDTRRVAAETDADSLFTDQFGIRRNDVASGVIDVEEAESTELPDSSYPDPRVGDELTGPVLAQQNDEFTCARCFLIVHRSRYARALRGGSVCRDCA